jgi:hypothetical protein
MRRHRWIVVVAIWKLCAGTPVDAEQPTPWLPLSEVMDELTQNPDFVEAVLERLGRDPNDGGILGPDQIRRLRSLVFGRHWEALDRFPGLTPTGLGRTLRLAAAAQGYFRDDDAPAPEAARDDQKGPPQPAVEPLGIPTGGPPLAPDAYLRTLGFGLEMGDRVDPELAPRHSDAARLAEVLNRLALNPPQGEEGSRYRVAYDGSEAGTPQDVIHLLQATGHEVEVRDARYFANFGDLIYRGHDVLTPFWLDTEIMVPGTERTLLVPVGHSQHELRLRGPQVNADLSFYFGIDGKAEFRPIDTQDQDWVLGRVAHAYRDEHALEVVRLAGAIVKTYAAIKQQHPDLAFGGYYALGVCNDVNAMIELHMQGDTTLFPLTLDTRYFDGEGKVMELARRLPVDGRGRGEADFSRVLGSLPVDDLTTLPLAGLRRDLELVRAEWRQDGLEYHGAWAAAWAAAGGFALAALALGRRVRRRSSPR